MRDWTEGPVRVLLGDALDRLAELPDESVHACVTSPPYWGLRDYGVTGQLGLESTPDEYVCRMVEVFREVRRVLRRDGTLWLNLGDSYAGSWGAQSRGNEIGEDKVRMEVRSPLSARRILSGAHRMGSSGTGSAKRTPGLKPKDLMMMPARVALALQADGWWLRSQIVWVKPNPMPESACDRPTTAHEYVYLLAKSERYFYDAEAVREESTTTRPELLTFGDERPAVNWPGHMNGRRRSKMPDGWDTGRGGHGSFHREGREAGAPSEIRTGRNLRSVWTIATQPYPEAHFATFPMELARRCIAAGTSEHGCCPACGAPWRRAVERAFQPQADVSEERGMRGHDSQKPMDESNGWQGWPRGATASVTTGWEPTCRCEAGVPASCTVLDPFAGSGTTLAVARRMGRQAVGIELAQQYLPLIQRRVSAAALPLLEALEAR